MNAVSHRKLFSGFYVAFSRNSSLVRCRSYASTATGTVARLAKHTYGGENEKRAQKTGKSTISSNN